MHNPVWLVLNLYIQSMHLHAFIFIFSFIMGKAIKEGTSAAVIRRAVVKASAREDFHTKFVSKLYF